MTHPGHPAARPADPQVPSDLLEGLNPNQAAAVQALLGPLVVVAGPGSGKTRVLTHRVAALVRTQLAWPSQILAVTFTNKAAGEMRERLIGLLGEANVERMWVTTFHSMCARILRIEHEAANLPRAFSILDTSETRTVLRGVLADLGLVSDAGAVRDYQQMISRIKNGAYVEPTNELIAVMNAYRTTMDKLAALDFDDLLLRTLDLMRRDPGVLERLRARFRFVLVDEYQDTNPVQYAMIALLAEGHRNVCAVGDADQAIYGFRSATPDALRMFTRDWPDARTVLLEQNYRSTSAIVETCRALIDTQHSELRPALFTTNPKGDPVRLVVCRDDRDEARFVARELVARPPGTTAAILMRTNAQSRVLEEALLLERLPYQVVGALRFYERAEIKDALAYLKVLTNPRDMLALTRVVGAPKRGLGPKALEVLADAAPDGDLVAALPRVQAGRYAKAFSALSADLETVRAAADQRGPAAALQAVYDLGLHAHVRSSGEGYEDRIENLGELLGAARLFTQLPNPVDPEGNVPSSLTPFEQVEAFLASVALVSDAVSDDSFNPEDNSPVQMMTAHAAKGKEFDVVYVVGVEEDLYPHSRSTDPASVDEERRLLFVACSRARQKLTVSRCLSRMFFGKTIENPPSRFLADLPDTVETIVRASPATGTSTWSWADKAHSPRRAVSSPAVSQASRRPAPAGPRLDPSVVSVGTRVLHSTFGPGVVIEMGGTGADTTAHVRFDDGAQRLLKVALAPLSLA